MSYASIKVSELGFTSNIQWKNIAILIAAITAIGIIIYFIKKKIRS